MKKIIVLILISVTLSFAGNQNKIIKLQERYKYEKKKEKEIIKLQEKTKKSLNYLKKLSIEENDKVIAIYRVLIEKVAQEILEKVRIQIKSTSNTLPKYLRIISVGDWLLYDYIKNNKTKEIFDKEIEISKKYILKEVDKEKLMKILIETNEYKTKKIKEMKKGEFRKLQKKYKKNFEKSIPLLFKNLLLLKLKIK